MDLETNSIISAARESDVDELARLVNSAYRGDSSRVGWTTEADFLDGQRTDRDSLLREIRDPNRRILCWREGGPIVGCVFLERFNVSGRVGCYLGMLTVSPTRQCHGMGKRLMDAAEKYASGWGADHMVLGVIQLRDTLMAWYERRGYQKTGNTKPFPYGNLLFGLPKRDDLYFVMFEKAL